MNTFTKAIDTKLAIKRTENGAIARNTTDSKLYDLFALGGAYRERSEKDQNMLFARAYKENPIYALKCLFYLRDCRGGQGERQFFRNCYVWLCKNHSIIAKRFLVLIPFYGRWDDLISLLDYELPSEIENEIVRIIRTQLNEDIEADDPSLLAKWMPSENTSSAKTKAAARRVRKLLGIGAADYRKLLSHIRRRLSLVESQMSQDRWDEIQFDKLPSVAGLKYSKAFWRNEKTSKRYKEFFYKTDAKVNANTLYPSDIVNEAINSDTDDEDVVVNTYWNNLPDYFKGQEVSLICVCDTSGSMWGKPIKNAIALSMYAAQRNKGDFHNYFITFSTHPNFVKIDDSLGFAEAARRIYSNTINDTTNLNAVFELLYDGVVSEAFSIEDLPKTLVVISDMEIDMATCHSGVWTKESCQTQMELLRLKWQEEGLKLPRLVYWNVDARNDTILDVGPDVSLVSGSSPILFEMICSGLTGYELMMRKLDSERYDIINW